MRSTGQSNCRCTGQSNCRSILVFADYSLSIQSLRLLNYAMSYFDNEPYFTAKRFSNEDAHKTLDWHYGFIEDRTILIPAREAVRIIQSGKKVSNNYKVLYKAVDELCQADILFKEKRNGVTTTKPARITDTVYVHRCDVKKQKFVVLSFSLDFMSAVVAESGYQACALSTINSFSSSHAARYYHWFLNGLYKRKFELKVEEIRQRFGLDEFSHQKHFFKRLVEQPVKEVIKKTDLQIDIEQIKDNQRRGNPLVRVKFKIKRDSSVDEISDKKAE
ncbi:replication initiation protein [Vibrio mediterranei]|uniref:replication initiation protein n=1 Tax=Vibrio mediterranei TaxID=689 RepID=UPI0038CEE547